MKTVSQIAFAAALLALVGAAPADEKSSGVPVLLTSHHGHFSHGPVLSHHGIGHHGFHGGHLSHGHHFPIHRETEDVSDSNDQQQQRDNEQEPVKSTEARSYGGYGAPAVIPVATSYGAPGCGISSPVIQGPSVGVFPSSNIGGCAVPLLLSCSPSVSSGHIVKQYASGYGSAGYAQHGVYRENEEVQQANKKE